MNDLFDRRTSKDKLWDWMKEKKQFSSVDLSKYDAFNYTLRSGRTAREFCEGTNPRLLRISTQDKIFRGLIKDTSANIAWYVLNPQWKEEINGKNLR